MGNLANSKTYGKVYFGLHMAEGVADYNDPGFTGRVLVLDNALDRMDPTFTGKPVFVHHVSKTDPEMAEAEADGWVIKSFRNKFDGKRWTKFIVTSDEAKDKIAQGWRLSNCYGGVDRGPGGEWHAVPYDAQIKNAEYRHLAIVPNPRYTESIILTEEEFDAYNSRLEKERGQFSNSTGDTTMKGFLKLIAGKLTMFNSTGVTAEKAKELETAIQAMPIQLASGRELSFEAAVTELSNADDKAKAEKEAEEKGEYPMANEHHMVEIGDQKMNVGALKSAYNALLAEKQEAAKAAEDKEKEHQNAMEAAKKDFDTKLAAAKKEAVEKQKNFDDLANANKTKTETPTVAIRADGVELGRQRYGSGS